MQEELAPVASGYLIADKAQHVQILAEGIECAAMEILSKVESGQLEMSQMFTKMPVHPQHTDSAGVDWLFLANTLNFSFWNNDRSRSTS